MNRSRAQVQSSDVSSRRARRRFIELDLDSGFYLWEIIVILLYSLMIVFFATWVYTPVGHFDGIILFFSDSVTFLKFSLRDIFTLSNTLVSGRSPSEWVFDNTTTFTL